MYSRWGYHRVWPWSHQLAVSQRESLGLGNRWGVKVCALLHQLTDSQRWSLGLHRWGYPRVFPLIHLWVAPQRVCALSLGLNSWGYLRVFTLPHLLIASQRESLGLGNRWGVKVCALLHQLADSQRSSGFTDGGTPGSFPCSICG